jgi:hypothetical protein
MTTVMMAFGVINVVAFVITVCEGVVLLLVDHSLLCVEPSIKYNLMYVSQR